MGCAASKAAAASPPPTSETTYEEHMKFLDKISVTWRKQQLRKFLRQQQLRPKPVSFEVKFPGDEAEANKEIKLPPQLQQRLEEQNNQNNLTVEELREKMQKAEERRLTILEEKKSVARQAQKMFSKGQSTPNGDKGGGEEVTEGS